MPIILMFVTRCVEQIINMRVFNDLYEGILSMVPFHYIFEFFIIFMKKEDFDLVIFLITSNLQKTLFWC